MKRMLTLNDGFIRLADSVRRTRLRQEMHMRAPRPVVIERRFGATVP